MAEPGGPHFDQDLIVAWLGDRNVTNLGCCFVLFDVSAVRNTRVKWESLAYLDEMYSSHRLWD